MADKSKELSKDDMKKTKGGRKLASTQTKCGLEVTTTTFNHDRTR